MSAPVVDCRSPEGNVVGLVDAVGVVARAAAAALARLGDAPAAVLDALADLRAEPALARLLAPRPAARVVPEGYAEDEPRCAGCDLAGDRYRRDCPRHGRGTRFAACQPDWRATTTGAPPAGWWTPAASRIPADAGATFHGEDPEYDDPFGRGSE